MHDIIIFSDLILRLGGLICDSEPPTNFYLLVGANVNAVQINLGETVGWVIFRPRQVAINDPLSHDQAFPLLWVFDLRIERVVVVRWGHLQGEIIIFLEERRLFQDYNIN